MIQSVVLPALHMTGLCKVRMKAQLHEGVLSSKLGTRPVSDQAGGVQQPRRTASKWRAGIIGATCMHTGRMQRGSCERHGASTEQGRADVQLGKHQSS